MKILALLVIILMAGPAWPADVNLEFDPSIGAADYRIEMSEDLGATWGSAQLTGGATAYLFIGVPEDSLIMFRVGALASGGREAINKYAGVWYDHRNKLASPGGVGIPHSTP